MRRIVFGLLLLGVPLPWVVAGEPGAEIPWQRRLVPAFEAAQAADKPLMIAINSERVDGGRVEPAAQELRDHTYKDKRVVTKAEAFVCAFLTAEGSSDDFGELRLRYGIDGLIVSPQHIFAYPDGSLISRTEYWPYGRGDAAVEALLSMMDKALAKDRVRRGGAGTEATPPAPTPPPPPAGGPGDPAAPAGPEAPVDPAAVQEARAKWIADTAALVSATDGEVRRAALKSLVEADAENDCVRAILALLPSFAKDTDALIDIVRALGRPGLEIAAAPIAEFLDHKELWLRANAAVSLEYIGSKTSADPLARAIGREKDEAVANHMHRALGRCGARTEKAMDLLAKKVLGAKSDFGALGPVIGLAYFEKDSKAAREVEKLTLKAGVGGRRGGWGTGALKRALLVWTLSEIGDPKSAEFIRKKLIEENDAAQDPWNRVVIEFYDAAARKCAGDAEAGARVQQGVEWALGRQGGNPLMDEARLLRSEAGFTPKGEFGGSTAPPAAPGGGAPPGGP